MYSTLEESGNRTKGPVAWDYSLEEEAWNGNRVRWRADAVVDARQICNVGVVLEIEVLAVPTGLEVDLGSHAIHTVGSKHIVLFWNIVSIVDAVETYSVGHRPCVQICQCRAVVGSLPAVPREHLEAGRKRNRIRSSSTAS